MRKKFLIFSLILIGFCTDSNRHLRGFTTPTKDGFTYLKIVEKHFCDQILIDGKIWQYPINEAGRIEPGKHIIDCNGEIGFTIPEKVVFNFDYWGP